MEVLLGLTGKDFTIIASSKAAMRGATILKAADVKQRELNRSSLLAYSGEAGDTGTYNYSRLSLSILSWGSAHIQQEQEPIRL